MDKLYTLNPRALWSQFRKEHFAFWMMCLYLIMEYVRPQSIYPGLDFLPWDKVFLGLAVLGMPFDPHKRWVRDSTNWWMSWFLVVIIVASILATFPSISWSHWFDFVGWYVIYFLIITIVTTKERYFIFLVIFLLANFKLSIFGARTWISRGFGFSDWGIAGPPGYFENSSDLSAEMLMFAPIAFELALAVKPHVKRVTYWFLMLGAVTGGMTVLAASARGSQIGLAAQGVWVAVQRKLKLKILVAIALVAALGYGLLPAEEKARFANAGTDNTSVQRLHYWQSGLKMIEDHPVLGNRLFQFSRGLCHIQSKCFMARNCAAATQHFHPGGHRRGIGRPRHFFDANLSQPEGSERYPACMRRKP